MSKEIIKNHPLISIIVPVYNVEKYLSTCIESLLKQQYKNIEILLIDDGSTDSSGKICDRYSFKYKNIKSFHKKNSGLGYTRNYGLKKVSGKYVTFVDSDDYVETDLIKKLVAPIILEQSIDGVIGGFTKITDTGQILYKKENKPETFKETKVKNILFPRMLGSLPDTSDSIKPSVWNCLYSVDLIKKYDLKFVSERDLISEDIEWDSQYFAFASKVVLINSTSYFYRANPNSLSKKFDVKKFDKYIYFYKYMKMRLNELKLDKYALLRLQKYFFVSLEVSIEQTNGLALKDALYEIKKICNNKTVIQVVDAYPINELSIKQRVFVQSIKDRYYLLLMLMSRIFLK